MAESGSRIEPFVLLARSTKGAAAAKVIQDATAAPGVAAFSELLELPNIQALRSDPAHQKSYHQLELFAYGTLDTHRSEVDSCPPLTAAQTLKLKHLTLVSLALQTPSLPYDQLLSSLQLSNVNELENLIIEAIYSGLLSGKMHHHEKVLHVDSVVGRDLRPEDLVKMQQSLTNWCATASSLLQALDDEIVAVQSSNARQSHENQRYLSERDDLIKHYLSQAQANGSRRNPRRGDNGSQGLMASVLGGQDPESLMIPGAYYGPGESGGSAASGGGRKVGLRSAGSAGHEDEGGRSSRGPKRFKDTP